MAGTLVPGATGGPFGHGGHRYDWPNLANGDTAEIAIFNPGADVGVQIVVLTGTPTVIMEGTLIDDGAGTPTDWLPLLDTDGTSPAFVASGWMQIKAVPKYARPAIIAGTGTARIVMVQR